MTKVPETNVYIQRTLGADGENNKEEAGEAYSSMRVIPWLLTVPKYRDGETGMSTFVIRNTSIHLSSRVSWVIK